MILPDTTDPVSVSDPYSGVDEPTSTPDQPDASATSQPADPAETESPEESQKKRESATQRRISKLIGDRANERLLRLQTEQRLAELEARLNGNPQGQQRGTPSDGPPREQDYDDWNKFQADTVRYHAKQAVAESQAASREAAQSQNANEEQLRERAHRVFANVEKHGGTESIPDFITALQSLPPDDPVIGEALLASDEPAAVAYYLAHHPDALEQVTGYRSPVAAARAIGRLEDKAVEFVQSRSRSRAKPQTAPLRSSVGSAPGTLRNNSGMDEHIASYRRYRAKRGY